MLRLDFFNRAGQGTGTAGAGVAGRHGKTDLPGYFYHLDQTLSSPDEFRANWLALADNFFSGKQLANILHNTAKHLVPRSESPAAQECLAIFADNMNVWEECVHDAQQTLNTRDHAISLWTCAAMSAVGHDRAFKPVAERIYERLPPADGDLDDISRAQIVQSCLWFDMPVKAMEFDQPEQTSATELKIAKLFQQAWGDSDVDLAYKIPGLHRIDIAVHGARDVLVEVDCHPSHFAGAAFNRETHREEPLYNLGTLFQSALIQKFASDAVLLRMPTTTVDTILSHDPHAGTLEADSLVRKARVRDGGTGHKALFGRKPFVRPLMAASLTPA